LNDQVQPFSERPKRQRGATQERIFLPQLRQFSEQADDRLAVGSESFLTPPSAAGHRSPVGRGSSIAIGLIWSRSHGQPLIPTRRRSSAQASLKDSTGLSLTEYACGPAATRDVPKAGVEYRT
jgi:hypothetical protein